VRLRAEVRFLPAVLAAVDFFATPRLSFWARAFVRADFERAAAPPRPAPRPRDAAVFLAETGRGRADAPRFSACIRRPRSSRSSSGISSSRRGNISRSSSEA
jgi:hypothetical protein